MSLKVILMEIGNIKNKLREIEPNIWQLDVKHDERMNVPVRIFTSKKFMDFLEEGAINQARNVACLPGIQKFSLAMPDMHFGYGFPIGGVAAFDSKEGIISPGGIGYDINCGVRLIRTDLHENEMRTKINDILNIMHKNVPAGVGRKGRIQKLMESELEEVLSKGARWAVENGYGWKDDLKRLEENGEMKTANTENALNEKTYKRGSPQLGSLGAGNHFLEIQKVEKIYDEDTAKAFGILDEGQIMVMAHTGSRGFGHQIATDYLRRMEKDIGSEGVSKLPDRELINAPFQSELGQKYFGAMSAAANYAFANRQMITHWIRESFSSVFGREAEELGMDIVYGICHNIGKLEKHKIDGKMKEVIVHRKGATRSLPPGHENVPEIYNKAGQPVIIPGSMGTASYVLSGTQEAIEKSFGSTAHGAGRVMSRIKAKKEYRGENIKNELKDMGISLKSMSWSGVAEEAPGAYKDVDEVVNISHRTGIGRLVAKLKPVGVIKG